MISWLDGNILASLVLLRPFLELALLHLYWYLHCETSGYAPFYEWLDGERNKPRFKDLVNFVFKHLPTKHHLDQKKIERRKVVLTSVYKWSCAYNHTPKIDESIVSLSGGIRVSPYSFFYYLASINLLLRQIVYLYVLAYPLSLFPVDRLRKWAFGGPIGLFFDHTNVVILRAYIGHNVFAKLRVALEQAEKVQEQLEGIQGLPDLTAQRIEADWERFAKENGVQREERSIGKRIAMSRAVQRATGWALNYMSFSPHFEDIPDELADRVMQMMKDW
jgi:hypothetical protein